MVLDAYLGGFGLSVKKGGRPSACGGCSGTERELMISRSGSLCVVLVVSTILAGTWLAPRPALSEPLADEPAYATPDATASSPSAGEVTVFVTSSPIHSEIIIPRSAFANASPLMRRIVDNAKGGPWIIFGWGPYWFGRETEGGPYHQQPKLGFNAVFTTFFPQLNSRVRVAALDEPGPAPLESSMFVLAVPISSDGLQRSIQRIAATIETTSDGAPVLSEQDGVAPGVTMYRSLEIYHAVHSCNFWVAEVLGAGGVRDGVAFDLFPESLYLELRAAGASPVSQTDLARATEEELRREAAAPADMAATESSNAPQ
jgi:hypothetical protein